MKEYALGADLGGTNIKFVIIDDKGKEIDYVKRSTEAKKGRQAILDNLLSGINDLLSRNKGIRIKGIGIGSPGLINKAGTVVTGAGNLPGWNGTKAGEYIKKKMKMPVFVDNDVTALALGEALFGAGKGYRYVLCVALGTGLGGGIIVDRRVYRGAHRYAAEFGHMVVNPDGAACTCGKRGCLESYVSAWGLKRLAEIYLKDNKESLILKMTDNQIENINPEIIFRAYEKGDRVARQVLNEMGHYLGIGFSILINIFDPDVIVVAGGISGDYEHIVKLVEKSMYDHTLPFYKNIKIKTSRFKYKAGAIGSASLVFEQRSSQ
ncbi:MAG: ROK family protein [Spirochaetes bacterium]|nr:ROK family protein [Spirochaetota bacterium]